MKKGQFRTENRDPADLARAFYAALAAGDRARALYEKLYCARGEMENRIKECQLDLFADRTSTRTMRANQGGLGCRPRPMS